MITVIKASGEKEPFSEEKVKQSITRAGIPTELHALVLAHVKEKLYDNIPSSEIYHHIAEFLDLSKVPFAKAKYRLKQAIMDLGPTGYPFEDFVAEILKTQGFQTEVRRVLQGNCITHEIDVIAEKKDGQTAKKIMVEAKFHNTPGVKTDVHVSLYTKARFDDVKTRHGFTDVWLVTNTKVSLDAVSYAECCGVHIISWSFPEGESLRDLIEQSGLTPITALTTISHDQKQKLLDQHIVLCRDVVHDPNATAILELSPDQKQKLLDEVNFLVQSTKRVSP